MKIIKPGVKNAGGQTLVFMSCKCMYIATACIYMIMPNHIYIYIYKGPLLTFLAVLRERLDIHTFIQVPITLVLFMIPSFKCQTAVYILAENVGVVFLFIVSFLKCEKQNKQKL